MVESCGHVTSCSPLIGRQVLRDERICVVAEQRPDCSEEESFQWMSRVLQVGLKTFCKSKVIQFLMTNNDM